MKRILSFFKQAGIKINLLGVFLLVIVLCSALKLALPELVRKASNAISAHDLSALGSNIIFAGVATIFLVVFCALSEFIHTRLTNKYEETLQSTVLEKYLVLNINTQEEKQCEHIEN
jgi:ABC-type uncharacterized transport system fused permease/ATPase subunit